MLLRYVPLDKRAQGSPGEPILQEAEVVYDGKTRPGKPTKSDGKSP